MDTLPSTRATQDLDRLTDKVSDHGVPLIVKRPGKRPEETIHLMRSLANARRLLKSIQSLDRGEGIERAIVEPKAQPRARSRRARK